MKNLEEAIYGIEQGTDVSGLSLVKQDGSKITLADLKGKPTALVFYASWNPYITESTIPVLKDMGVLQGAGTGAAIGSVIPGIGTAPGAIAGGIIGLGKTIGGWISGKDKEKKQRIHIS